MKSVLPLVAFAAIALAGCQQQAQDKQSEATAAKRAKGPDTKPGLSLQGGRLVLPAVKGNPGAAYFMLDNASSRTVELAAIAIDGAGKAEIHQTAGDGMMNIDHVEMIPATSIVFEPGKLHVMVFDIDARLQPGGTTAMTLSFADGDKLSAPLKIEAPGGSAGAGDMEHGAMH